MKITALNIFFFRVLAPLNIFCVFSRGTFDAKSAHIKFMFAQYARVRKSSTQRGSSAPFVTVHFLFNFLPLAGDESPDPERFRCARPGISQKWVRGMATSGCQGLPLEIYRRGLEPKIERINSKKWLQWAQSVFYFNITFGWTDGWNQSGGWIYISHTW